MAVLLHYIDITGLLLDQTNDSTIDCTSWLKLCSQITTEFTNYREFLLPEKFSRLFPSRMRTPPCGGNQTFRHSKFKLRVAHHRYTA